VHIYLLRHVYFESMRLKYGHSMSVFLVYLVSGIMHEYVMYIITN